MAVDLLPTICQEEAGSLSLSQTPGWGSLGKMSGLLCSGQPGSNFKSGEHFPGRLWLWPGSLYTHLVHMAYSLVQLEPRSNKLLWGLLQFCDSGCSIIVKNHFYPFVTYNNKTAKWPHSLCTPEATHGTARPKPPTSSSCSQNRQLQSHSLITSFQQGFQKFKI